MYSHTDSLVCVINEVFRAFLRKYVDWGQRWDGTVRKVEVAVEVGVGEVQGEAEGVEAGEWGLVCIMAVIIVGIHHQGAATATVAAAAVGVLQVVSVARRGCRVLCRCLCRNLPLLRQQQQQQQQQHFHQYQHQKPPAFSARTTRTTSASTTSTTSTAISTSTASSPPQLQAERRLWRAPQWRFDLWLPTERMRCSMVRPMASKDTVGQFCCACATRI